ncbi:hypothetical protein V1506DRAFT_523971 [Lipomyces tetrasporus]
MTTRASSFSKPILFEGMTVRSGGTFVPRPFYTPIAGDAPITVHSIGGGAMAKKQTARPASRTIIARYSKYSDGRGKTDIHTGLYVVDGAVIPTAIRVNPFLTITAIAERTVELAARDRGWVINPRIINHAVDYCDLMIAHNVTLAEFTLI